MSREESSFFHRYQLNSDGLLQTALLLCVADSHPGMFKTLAACKLEPLSNEFGEDSVQVWAGITVSAPLSSPCQPTPNVYMASAVKLICKGWQTFLQHPGTL